MELTVETYSGYWAVLPMFAIYRSDEGRGGVEAGWLCCIVKLEFCA